MKYFLLMAGITIAFASSPTGKVTTDNGIFIFDSDRLGNIPMGYENLTNELRAQLNEEIDAKDYERQCSFNCVKDIMVNSKKVACQVGEKSSSTKAPPLTLLVMGNSWAENIMNVVHTECQDVFSSLYISGMGGCEPLYRTVHQEFDCTADWRFQAAAEEIKPDVVLIMTRHLTGLEIKDGTNPFDDDNFATAIKRLDALEKVVKKKIYILDAFPLVKGSITRTLTEYLRNGKTFEDSDVVDFGPGYLIARQRMYRLVQGCPKCELIDFANQFYFNGEFKVYDPKYHVTFINGGRHLSPPAWERVRPQIRHLCHHL